MSAEGSCAAGAAPAIRASRLVRWVLALATAASFLLVLQNYVIEILPERIEVIPTGQIRPYSTEATFAYVYAFNGSEPDQWPSMRSRVSLFEDGHRYSVRTHKVEEVTQTGGERFSHEPGRIIFAARDNTDPRSNGHAYWLSVPVLYRRTIGVPAMLAFLACAGIWLALGRRPGSRPPEATATPSRWRWHLAGSLALFLLGLYLNTGTLAPYANTCAPMVVAKDTGYVYNQDHPHYRVLFDFVDGREKAVWDHAIFLRRILFPVLGWPLMRLFGFEIGGTMAAIALNVAALLVFLEVVRLRMGERGAIFAAWALALYPGAAYWAGMPYAHALIVPDSLLLFLGVWSMVETTGAWRVAWVSLAMGVGYLGYDLGMFFLPATLVALCWRRRFLAAVSSVVLQLAPQACWLFALKHVFGQPLLNANSGIFRSALDSFVQSASWAGWLHQLAHAADIGLDVFFSSNFLFLPALFVFVLAANPLTSRIRFHLVEVALLVSALGLFLFLNLAPSQDGTWQMGGTWISRIYQPILPALVLFMARWWGNLPPLNRPWRVLVGSALVATAVGNLLIIFGPILDNPGRVSEEAFYRFYDHSDAHFVYEGTLNTLGRRPIGFPVPQRPPPPAPTAAEIRAQQQGIVAEEQVTLGNLRKAVVDNQAALAANQQGFREAGKALAEVRLAMYEIRMKMRENRGEVTAEEARKVAKTWRDFVEPSLRDLLDAPPPGPPRAGEPAAAVPSERADVEAALKLESARLVELQRAIGKVQAQLSQTQSELTQGVADLRKLEREQAAPKAP